MSTRKAATRQVAHTGGNRTSTMGKKFTSIEEYLSTLPAGARKVMDQLRSTIREAVPDAEEVISYNMPAFKQQGILIWYAAWKEHIGIYPKTKVGQVFAKELAGYELSKGTIKFPLNEPLPLNLIRKIVAYRAAENLRENKSK